MYYHAYAWTYIGRVSQNKSAPSHRVHEGRKTNPTPQAVHGWQLPYLCPDVRHARPDQKVGPVGGTFGSTIISKNCFQKFLNWHGHELAQAFWDGWLHGMVCFNFCLWNIGGTIYEYYSACLQCGICWSTLTLHLLYVIGHYWIYYNNNLLIYRMARLKEP